MVILVLDSRYQTWMVYMISMMWVPYWNTTVPTVDNLCWCRFNYPQNTHTHTNFKTPIKNQLPNAIFTLCPHKIIVCIVLLTLVFSISTYDLFFNPFSSSSKLKILNYKNWIFNDLNIVIVFRCCTIFFFFVFILSV